MLLLTLCATLVTALSAQLRTHVPWTQVPVTGQVFVVLVCGVMLGGLYGTLSQILYIGLAIVGVPWLAMTAAGLAFFNGLTSGYLYGFVLAAAFLGVMTSRFARARTLDGQIYLMLAAIGIIYLCGATGIMFVTGCSPFRAVAIGIVPFVPIDLLKVVAAAGVTHRFLRQ